MVLAAGIIYTSQLISNWKLEDEVAMHVIGTTDTNSAILHYKSWPQKKASVLYEIVPNQTKSFKENALGCLMYGNGSKL